MTEVPLRVGADPNGENRFHGRILRAAIYGRALTAPEIAQRAALLASVPGAVGEWNFGGGAAGSSSRWREHWPCTG